MEAKTIIAIALVAVIVGGFIFLQVNINQLGQSVKNSVPLFFGGTL